MQFTKMHGIGNDYVYVNGFVENIADPTAVARKVSDRHFGIGSDGLILILPSDKADVRMRMFNIDGSEGEMCGNGIRCVAKYAFDHGLTKNNPMRVETGRGVLTLDLKTANGKVEFVTVNMGQPILKLAEIPVDRELVGAQPEAHEYLFMVSRRPTADELAAGKTKGLPLAAIRGIFVNVGNPHVVTFVEDVAAIPIARLGPLVENYKAFPKRINAHWVQVISPREVTMRTWERGSGITWACGTGASSVCVAGNITGRTDRKVLAHLPGGDLNIEWREADNNVYMTGPATEVFSGEWNG
jgi:diaminopimelate epimerase